MNNRRSFIVGIKSIKLSKKDHFITFHNINKAYPRMENLLDKFKFTSFSKFIQENKEKLY